MHPDPFDNLSPKKPDSNWSINLSRQLPRLGSRRFWIVIAGILSLLYAFSVLIYVLWAPDLGVRCAFTTVVNHFYPQFLDPATPDQRGPEPHDTIVRLDDTEIQNWPQLLHCLQDVADHPTVRIYYKRDGIAEPFSVICRPGPPPIDNLIPSVAWFFLKLGLFLVGAIVFWNRPDDRSAAQFFLLSIVSLGAFIGGYHWSRIVTQPLLLVGFMICSVLLPAVTLHFYLLFPRPKSILQRMPRRVLAVVYSPALFLMLLLTDYLRIRWMDTTGSSQAVNWLLQEMMYEIYVYFAVAVLWYLGSIACLIHSYRTAVDTIERDQVRWIMFGSMAALGPIGYTLYMAVWDQERFGSGGGSWPMFAASFCFTVAFTISITRYRLLQIDQILSSGMVYFLVSGLAGLVYYGLVFVGMLIVGSGVLSGPSVGQALIVSSITALFLMVGLDVVRGRLKGMLDRHYRREKRQLDDTLQRMSQAIEQLVDPPTLARRLLHTSADLLNVSTGAVYLRKGEPPLYFLTDSLGPAPALTELSPGCPLIEALRLKPTVVARPRPAPADPAQRQLHFVNAGVAQALFHEGQLLGLLVLGQRIVDPYTREDLNLLSSVAQLSVLALVSAEGHRTIETLNHELQNKVEKIAEQQRRIFALQSQLNARSRLTTTRAAEEKREVSSTAITAELAPQEPAPALPEGMVGSSPQVRQLMHLVRKVAASPSAVLLRGESGTGKELLARALHDNSARAGKAFIKVHCAALSPTLLESELFGHVKGAFTNAIRDKVGRFEAAHAGTLFLDEIGDISLDVQTKLLRVLQERTFERVGSSEPMTVDVRLIAATHQDLEGLIETGRFRQDLYYRLNVISIAVPPLRERVEDIPELAQHFIRLNAARAGREPLRLDDDALEILKAYPWPGNIRELENVIERAVVIAEGKVLTPAELPIEVSAGAAMMNEDGSDMGDTEPSMSEEELSDRLSALSPTDAKVTLHPRTSIALHVRAESEQREREQLVRALSSAGGNKAEAARALGVARSTLVSRLKRLGLS